MNVSQQCHKAWLLVTAIIVGAFGPVFSLGTMEWSSEPARWSLDLLSWPLDGAQSYDFPTMRFLSALTGGFLFGWGVMIFCLRRWVYDEAPAFGVRSSLDCWRGLSSTVWGPLHQGHRQTLCLTSLSCCSLLARFGSPSQRRPR